MKRHVFQGKRARNPLLCVSIAQLVHFARSRWDSLDFTQCIIEAVFVFEHDADVVDGDWRPQRVSLTAVTASSKLNDPSSLSTLGLSDSVKPPMLMHGRPPQPLLQPVTRVTAELANEAWWMLRCFWMFLLSELHCLFENFIVFHLSLISFSELLT